MRVAEMNPRRPRGRLTIERLLEALGVEPGRAVGDRLPFAPGDATAGSESELQAAVCGPRQRVDLPRTIEQSNYFRNLIRRHRQGEAPQRVISELEGYLGENRAEVWENSWVRFPRGRLSAAGRELLAADLRAVRSNPQSPPRADAGRFAFREDGREMLRLPVSYLLKLALAEALAERGGAPELIAATGRRLMDRFLSDNTSPETSSFYVCGPVAGSRSLGAELARETGLRYLLSQLLCDYAGRRLGLEADGQRALVYFAPSPPERQKELNACISDSFYRELFMSPCLSGWDRGEDKHRYMHLCHQVLSRSQLNAVAKLKEAGIITSNLVVLPNVSNTSLANNGTHVSLGSARLGRALAAGGPFTAGHEKHLGDLVIKAVEHFLPLFVGAYSAAPYRLAFEDFHPERVLSFLPHELDYTHLRMMWRRWKKKARLKVCGRPLTPFGPLWLDRAVSRVFRLRGDFVADFRLLDYPACLLSTHQSPALDGLAGNQQRLLADLAEEGVFDRKMAVYLLYRQREHAAMGYAGFEGRHYSLFPSLARDLAPAVDLQAVVTALCVHYAVSGRVSHALIPDGPELESERRQIFFGAAVGLPTFFVRADTPNHFLRMIVERARRVRPSRRYPGYLRVHNLEYRRALVSLLRADAAALGGGWGLEGLLDDLERRLEDWPRASAAGRLTTGVLAELGVDHPLKAPAGEFNAAAEKLYRGGLRRAQLAEALDQLREACAELDRRPELAFSRRRQALAFACGGLSAAQLVERATPAVLAGEAGREELARLIHLILVVVDSLAAAQGAAPEEHEHAAPVHRAALGKGA
jgi:hypothetical protein